MLESLVGLDGREQQQLQYQALHSLLHAAAAVAPASAALVFVVEGPLFTAATLETNGYSFSFFFYSSLFLFYTDSEGEELSICGRTNVLTTRGQRSVPAGGLGRTAGNVISERFRAELHRTVWVLVVP